VRSRLSSRASSARVAPLGARLQTKVRLGTDDAPLALVRDPLRMLLLLLTIVTISRVHLRYPVLAAMRPVLLLSALALGYVYLNPRQLTPTNVLRLWPMRLVALLGILSCCSAAFGISLGGSASFILDSYSKTIAYAFLLAMSTRHVRDLYTFVWAYVISCGILAFFSLFVFELETGGGYTARLAEMYTYDSNDLGVVMMIGLPLTLLLLVVDRGAKRWVLLVSLIGNAATMARSGSRGGFLGLLAVGLAALFLVKGVSTARRVLLLAATALALSVAAPPGYWKQMATIMSPKDDYNYSSLDGRNELIKRGLGYMSQYPVFGVGIWNFARAECTISPKIATRTWNGPLRCTAPHNSYVQAGTELGVPGLVIFVSLLIGGVVAPIRLRRFLPPSWRKGSAAERFLYAATSFFPVAVIGFAVTSFFVTFAFSDPIYVLAAFVTGLYIAVGAQLGAAGRPGPARQSASDTFKGWRVRRSARWLPRVSLRSIAAR
jgi:O-antigen ligase